MAIASASLLAVNPDDFRFGTPIVYQYLSAQTVGDRVWVRV